MRVCISSTWKCDACEKEITVDSNYSPLWHVQLKIDEQWNSVDICDECVGEMREGSDQIKLSGKKSIRGYFKWLRRKRAAL